MHSVIFCAPLEYRPQHEAISKEISLLLPADGRTNVVTVPPFATVPWTTSSESGVRVVHPGFLLVPGLARLFLPAGDLVHVFTPLPLPRRIALLLSNVMLPAVVTVISHGGLGRPDFEILCRTRRVVAECQRDRDRLLADGLPTAQVSLIPPATAVGGSPLPVPDGPLTLLFASSPLQPAEMEQRGVDLLVAAARRLPDVQFRLLWRPGAEQCLTALPDLPNLILDQTLYTDITEVLKNSHAVVTPFRAGGKAKSVPLSAIEALQCGRPVLVSSAVGVADLVNERGCGVVFEPGADQLVAAIETLQQQYDDLQDAAARSSGLFSVSEYRRAYAELVAEC